MWWDGFQKRRESGPCPSWSLQAGQGALDELLLEFRALGGEGIEVITSSHTPEQSLLFARHAQRLGLWLRAARISMAPEKATSTWAGCRNFPRCAFPSGTTGSINASGRADTQAMLILREPRNSALSSFRDCEKPAGRY